MSPAFPQGFRHQWWCPLGLNEAITAEACTCLSDWDRYERTRCAGWVYPRPLPTDLVEGPPCRACEGKAEHTDADGVRRPCAPGDGTRHPACRGNGGGRMSPAAEAAWLAERAAQNATPA